MKREFSGKLTRVPLSLTPHSIRIDSKFTFFKSQTLVEKQRMREEPNFVGYELTNLVLRKCFPELAIRTAEKQPFYPGKDPKSLRISNTSVNG